MEALGLSPYGYQSFPLPLRAVGWLGGLAGSDIGVSLGLLRDYEFAAGLRAEDFNSEVQRGLEQAGNFSRPY